MVLATIDLGNVAIILNCFHKIDINYANKRFKLECHLKVLGPYYKGLSVVNLVLKLILRTDFITERLLKQDSLILNRVG